LLRNVFNVAFVIEFMARRRSGMKAGKEGEGMAAGGSACLMVFAGLMARPAPEAGQSGGARNGLGQVSASARGSRGERTLLVHSAGGPFPGPGGESCGFLLEMVGALLRRGKGNPPLREAGGAGVLQGGWRGFFGGHAKCPCSRCDRGFSVKSHDLGEHGHSFLRRGPGICAISDFPAGGSCGSATRRAPAGG
jgi:hypothetical protein